MTSGDEGELSVDGLDTSTQSLHIPTPTKVLWEDIAVKREREC